MIDVAEQAPKKRLGFVFLLKLLFVPILYELVIGGGGRFTELGPITVRMLFYFLAVMLSLIYFSVKKAIRKEVVLIVFLFTCTLIVSTVTGYLNGAVVGNILEDIKPLSFFYILLFFSITIRSINDVNLITKIIKIGSLIMAVGFVTVVLLLLTGVINFRPFYDKQFQIGEIMFRNDALFFYKGFVYLCIGFFFFLLANGFWNKVAALFLLFTVVLTLTRGLILFTSVIFIYYILFINRNALIKWITLTVGTIGIIIVLPMLFGVLGDKTSSDSTRYNQINEVIAGINPISLFVGHGFGIGVESRPIHMELSFLEIFHKQGIIGLSFWIGLLVYIFLMYYNIKNKVYRNLALPFLLSVIFIILQSATNPYMNNPIGLTIILLSLILFSRLVELQKNEIE